MEVEDDVEDDGDGEQCEGDEGKDSGGEEICISDSITNGTPSGHSFTTGPVKERFASVARVSY